jgi:hypothetical protein
MNQKRGSAYGRSTIVALVLAVFTVVEYFLATTLPGESLLVPMFIIGLLKAAAVVYFYMHISRLWSSEGGH